MITPSKGMKINLNMAWIINITPHPVNRTIYTKTKVQLKTKIVVLPIKLNPN